MENDLEEQVAHFVGKFRVVAGVESVHDFVSFFDQVRAERGVGLLDVPRAALGRAQPFLNRY